MAFGSGILISAIAFDLHGRSLQIGGLVATAGGFLVGAVIFTAGSLLLARAGARHRMRSKIDGADDDVPNTGAIALGTAIDGIPESIADRPQSDRRQGRGDRGGDRHLPVEHPGGAVVDAGMKAAGRRPRYIFCSGSITVMSGGFSLVGYAVFAHFPPEVVAFTQASPAAR